MKIALLGAAPSSRKLAPFMDPDWEIWACSPPNYDLPRVDAWFEVHSLKRKFENPANGPYLQLLRQHPRVYVNYIDPDRKAYLPESLPYPIDEMIAAFGKWFFTSSLAYMAAMAITKYAPTHIGFWGVDMSAAEEYGYQRAGCHFFIREAASRGIRVVAAPESDILNPVPLYGFKEQSPMWRKQRARRRELEQRIAICDQILEQKQKERLIVQGALDDMNYIDNTYDPLMTVPPSVHPPEVPNA